MSMSRRALYILTAATAALFGCGARDAEPRVRIAFLHHSTGRTVWDGGLEKWLKGYNREHGTGYTIDEIEFPKESPYGWNNYPFDYWNIWVRHGGDEPHMEEPTLEILCKEYDVVMFKHCFPVSGILPDTGSADIASSEKRLENYRLQYGALRGKMRSLPATKFIVWTGAALVRGATDEEQARRAREFFEWVAGEWDEPGDNIFVWDFYGLETEGGLYLRDEYAKSPTNSHPGEAFARRVAPLLGRRIVDVIEGRGDE